MAREWTYDESVAPGVDYSRDDTVAVYEKGRAEIGDPSEEARQLIGLLGVKKDWTIVDLGCGTGAFVAEVAHHCRRVIGVDVSPKMLAGARQRMQDAGLTNVELVKAGFLSYLHQGDPADAITTKVAFHHLPDFWKQIALLKMDRMLRPGGKLCIADVVYSFKPADHQKEYDGYLERMRKIVSPEFIKNVELDLSREFMTMDWIMEEMLARAGFRIERQWKPDKFFALYLCAKTEAA
jgi:putative AdoMet-dependent methyltransferase